MTSASEPGADPGAATREAVRGEIRDFVRAHERRRHVFPRALLVGLLAGLVAVAFRAALSEVERLRGAVVAVAGAWGAWGALVPVSLCALTAAVAVALVERAAPETAGSGIPHLKAVLHHLRPLVWSRVLPVKFAGGVLAIGAGLALGREGPTVQMGGALGQMVSGWLRSTARERRTLIAAGAGAGLAAAFNAPLSGLVFVLEEVQRDFTPTVFTATFIAAITADVVTRWLTGQAHVFHVAVAAAPPIASLPAFAVLGLVAGLLGVAFNRGLLAGLDALRGLGRRAAWARGAAVGAGAGLVAWFAPSAVGTGGAMLDAMFAGELSLASLAGFFLLRFALTMASYGSGAAGGIFAPLLVLGAQVGLVVGDLSRRAAPALDVPPVTFAVVGMAAYFAAIVRAPLTGIVLIVEMTGGYELMLALLVACLTAYGTADLLGDLPIYERLLARELGRDDPTLAGPLLLDLAVRPGARLDGRVVRDLQLPDGCVLVAVRGAHGERVPTADLRLASGDRLVLLIAPTAAGAVEELRAQAEQPAAG